jgi:mRNA interferase MazF
MTADAELGYGQDPQRMDPPVPAVQPGRRGFRVRHAMKRGDVVTVAATGDYGKPRPAVIVQTDALPAKHASIVVCQMTSELSEAPEFRVTVEPTEGNGLRARSQVMADKPVTIRRERIGQQVGRLDEQDIARLNVALAFLMGLAD